MVSVRNIFIMLQFLLSLFFSLLLLIFLFLHFFIEGEYFIPGYVGSWYTHCTVGPFSHSQMYHFVYDTLPFLLMIVGAIYFLSVLIKLFDFSRKGSINRFFSVKNIDVYIFLLALIAITLTLTFKLGSNKDLPLKFIDLVTCEAATKQSSDTNNQQGAVNTQPVSNTRETHDTPKPLRDLLGNRSRDCGYIESNGIIVYESQDYKTKVSLPSSDADDFSLLADSCAYVQTNGSVYYAYNDNWGGPYIPDFKQVVGAEASALEIVNNEHHDFIHIAADNERVYYGWIPFANAASFEILGWTGYKHPVLISKDKDSVYIDKNPIKGLDPDSTTFDGVMPDGSFIIGDKNGVCSEITQVKEVSSSTEWIEYRECLRN